MDQQAPREPRPSPRITIKDVAEEAGVSPSTVSHAFSGRRVISEATKERIFAVAQRLGYSADPLARSMRTRRSGVIGLVLRPRFAASGAPEFSETFNRLAGSMAIECLRRGIGLVHVPDPTNPGYDAVPMDGCIIAHPYARDPTIDFLTARGIPIACADPDPDRPDLPWTVGIDYATGMRHAFDALGVPHGGRVWLMPGTEDNAWNRQARHAYSQLCERISAAPEIYDLREDLTPAEVEEYVSRLLTTHGAPSALVFSTSKAGTAVQSALAGAGLSVPGDIRLAALTDSSQAQTPSPPITALDLNHESLASAAVGLMMARISGEQAPAAPQWLSPALHVRGSTGA